MNEFAGITAPLIAWYQQNKRDLPWRIQATPYRVWVSEIMLQQTRVEAVKEYYVRFLETLPTIEDLAFCEEEKLLKLWEGLGYYSRVRNMQKAAKIIVEKGFPSTEKELCRLPGIGEYTAGAISSIAFFKRVAAVDGNVMRVLSRYAENPTDISTPSYKRYLKERLEEIYPEEGVLCSDFTQALMELGAVICTPQVYRCEQCPLKGGCASYKNGSQEFYPNIPQKKEKKKEELFVFLIETEKGFCIRKRESGVLKGMNEFPSKKKGEKAIDEILKGWGIEEYQTISKRGFSHIFTHIAWEMECIHIRTKYAPFDCYTIEKLQEEVALPTAFKQLLSMIKG